MKYQVLARKWRPHNFTEVVGQEHVVKALTNALQYDRLHHAYLFTGTRGVGKTTLARILAKAINCENRQDFNPCGRCLICKEVDEGRFLDLIEVDAASRTKVEDTRDLLDNAQYAPNQGRYKVYLIDEVHMLSGHSFNALLKTLEEPPPHVKFLLATTDPHKIPVTVLSRCLQFNLKRLLPEQILAQMAFILEQEQIEFETVALKSLARAADGSMRDGLSLLDQAIVFGGGRVFGDDVYAMLGTVAQQPVETLLTALAQGDALAVLDKVGEMAELTPDFGDVVRQLLQLLHRIALNQQMSSALAQDFDVDVVAALSERLSPEDVQLFYQIALLGQKDLELAPDPRMGFEMLMLRMLAFKPVGLQISPERSVRTAPAVAVDKKPVKPESGPKAVAGEAHPGANAIIGDWAGMIAAMGLESITKQLASHCVLESIDDKVCTLLLESAHQNLLTPMRSEKLQKALQAYRGTALRLVINVGIAGSETPAAQLAKQREDRQQAAVDSINADENVLALKERFDARVVSGTIEPV